MPSLLRVLPHAPVARSSGRELLEACIAQKERKMRSAWNFRFDTYLGMGESQQKIER